MSIASTSSVRMMLEPEIEQLFRDHSHMLFRTALSLLGNAEDAEDVLQTIFLRLLRGGLTPDLQKNAKGYLYRAAVNLSLDTIRARRRGAKMAAKVASVAEYVESSAATADSEVAEDRHRRLGEAFAELDPAAAEILVLRYVHNYSDAQIAKLLGSSRGAIAMRLLRSRARLKKLMRDSLGEQR